MVRIREWVTIPFSTGSSGPRDQTRVSCNAGKFFTTEPPESESESCSVLSLSETPWKFYIVHGILQARTLEWLAFPFSRRSSQPRDRTQVSSIAGRFFTS